MLPPKRMVVIISPITIAKVKPYVWNFLIDLAILIEAISARILPAT